MVQTYTNSTLFVPYPLSQRYTNMTTIYTYKELTATDREEIRKWFKNKSLPVILTDQVLIRLGIKQTNIKENN